MLLRPLAHNWNVGTNDLAEFQQQILAELIGYQLHTDGRGPDGPSGDRQAGQTHQRQANLRGLRLDHGIIIGLRGGVAVVG